MGNSIKALIFDMGGVLLQTEDSNPRESMAERFGTTRRALEQFVFLSPTSLLSEVGNMTDMEHWQTVLDHFSVKGLSPQAAYRQFFSGDVVNQTLLDFITALKEEYKIGLLSNAWMNARENLRRRYDFLDYFDVSIFSAEAGTRKPEPAIFLKILNRLNVQAEEAIFIDDFEENIQGATKLGLHAIHYTDNASTVARIHEILKK